MAVPQAPAGRVFATEGTQNQTGKETGVVSTEGFEEELDELWGMETGEQVRYLERWWDDNQSVLGVGVGSVSEYTEVTDGVNTWEDGWYVVKSDVTLEQLVTVNGRVFLILMDNTTLTAKRGIRVSAGNSLFVYAQSDKAEMGKLVVTCGDDENNEEGQAGIGGGKGQAGGEIVIHGGDISAHGGWGGAGIGGGLRGRGGEITIHGGKISAIGGTDTINTGAGIGGGSYGMGGNITINGGQITVTEEGYYADGAAGIGGGYYASGENIVIRGGTINVSTGDEAAGIGGGTGKSGGEISIYGGDIISQGGYAAPGIGHGVNVYETTDMINIYGGNITSTGGNFAAGIGGGRYGSGKVVIHDGTITAIGGNYGAGIGGGEGGTGGEVVIYGGKVTATSGTDGGAGIGGGYRSAGGKITIHGGTVTATGEDGGAGIGGGKEGAGGEIAIYGGTVLAVGLDTSSWGKGAGIGGGDDGNGANVLITGGNIKAIMDTYTEGVREGIGAGAGGSSEGTITDANGNDLVLSTISLCGVEEIVDISSAAGNVEYGVKDVSTLDHNVLYFYLPTDAKLDSVVADGQEYFGNLTTIPKEEEREGTYHKYEYTQGANDTILAGCSTQDCDNNATVAIVAPQETVFTGSAIEAVSEVTPENMIFPVITYEAVTGNLTDGKPVNCGTYNAKISLDEIEIGTSYEITKKTPEVSDFIYADPKPLRYDGKQKIPTITSVYEGMGNITLSYYNYYDSKKTPIDAPVNAGLYAVKVSVDEGENYTAVQGLETSIWRFGVEAAILDSSYFTYAAPKELVFDGSSKQAEVKAAEGIEGLGEITLSYYPVVDGIEGEEVTPVDAGTYKVKVHVAQGNNNNETTELVTDDSWSFTVTPAETRITSVSGKRNQLTDATIYNTTTVDEIILTGVAVDAQGMEVSGTFKLADTVTALKKGSHSYPCKFVPDGVNYLTSDGSVTLNVVANEVDSIAITKIPEKQSYIYGDKFDFTGATVMATYKDGSVIDVTEQVIWEDTILEKEQTEVEITYTFEGKTVTAKVEGISIMYLEEPSEILYNDKAEKEWYGSADGNVIITVDGYTVSDRMNGNYTASYRMAYEKDGICSKKLYFKNADGQMTDGVEVDVQYDRSSPVFGGENGIQIKEHYWNKLQESVGYALAYNDTEILVNVTAKDVGGSEIATYHYYVDTSGTNKVFSKEELEGKTFVTTTDFVIDTISEENTYVYYVYVTDYAGNRSEYICSEGIRIDRTKPVITEMDVPTNSLLDVSAVVHAGAEDDESGVKEYYLVCSSSDLSDLVNESNITTYEGVIKQTDGTFTLNGLAPNTNYYCCIAVKDEAGNIACSFTSFTTKKTMPIFDDGDIPTISGIYGQLLSDMKLSVTEASSKNHITGTWSITAENKTETYPTVGTESSYEITFTPDDTNAYSLYVTRVIPQVSKKQVTVKMVTAESREYEPGNNAVNVEIILEGIIQSDQVLLAEADYILGTISSINAGSYSKVTLPRLVLTGKDAGNYEMVQPQGAVTLSQNVEIHKADAEVVVSKDSYNKIFGDAAFMLEVTDNNPETDVQYEVIEGTEIVAVNQGTVTILKAGIAMIQVELPESTNYKAAANKVVRVAIEKKDGYTVADIQKSYLYLRTNEEAISLKELLPTDCGAVEYEISGKEGNISYSLEPQVINGTLKYTVNTGNINDMGNITVTAVTENYEDITILVNLKLADRMSVGLKEGSQVTVNKAFMTFGETLDTMEFHVAEFVDMDGNKVLGTLAWKTPKLIPEAGTFQAEWIFTPSDTQAYLNTEGSITITIKKAQAQVSIESGKESYCKKFVEEDFGLEGITTTGDGILTYAVSEGKALNGEDKNAADILTVSTEGVVSLHSTGTVTVFVTTTETANYLPAQPKEIQIEVMYADEFLVEEIEEPTYTGKALKPKVRVLDGMSETVLQEGKDYTVSYKNNTKAYTLKPGEENQGFDESKAPYVLIKGKGNYSSSMKVYFTIQPKDISGMEDESIVVKEILLEENDKVQKKVPTLTYNKKKLNGVLKPEDGSMPAKVKDFVYSYPQLGEEDTKESAFKEAGTWKILVEGSGNYKGSRYIDVIIAPKGGKMSGVKIEKISVQEYSNGKPIELDDSQLVVIGKIEGEKQTLIKDTHYTVKYKNNTQIGTATVFVKGIAESGFAGTKTATFKITGTKITKAEVMTSKVYNASEQKPDLQVTAKVKVTTKEGVKEEVVTLTEEDYEVLCNRNTTDVGTVKLTIKGKGAYTGTINKNFKITAYDMSGETDKEGNIKKDSLLTEENGLFAKKDGELTVKYVKGGAKPQVKLVFAGEPLTEGKDYTITYKNNKNVYTLMEGMKGYKASKAPTIIIKGKGNFKGSISKTFVITGRTLQDSQLAVAMTVDDKAVSTKKGGYISKPVLTDKDGNVLKQGKDYTAPVYTMHDENGETITLGSKDKVEAGSVITVTVKGLGAYAGEEPMTATYVITRKNFSAIKVAKIQKPYTGRDVLLTERDFYNEDGSSKITIGSGKNKEELKYGKDFEIVPESYKNHRKKGTASVTLRGITKDNGLYGGTKTIKFTIGSRGFKDWLAWLWR